MALTVVFCLLAMMLISVLKSSSISNAICVLGILLILLSFFSNL